MWELFTCFLISSVAGSRLAVTFSSVYLQQGRKTKFLIWGGGCLSSVAISEKLNTVVSGSKGAPVCPLSTRACFFPRCSPRLKPGDLVQSAKWQEKGVGILGPTCIERLRGLFFSQLQRYHYDYSSTARKSVIFYQVERRPPENIPCSHGHTLGGAFSQQECSGIDGRSKRVKRCSHPCGPR